MGETKGRGAMAMGAHPPVGKTVGKAMGVLPHAGDSQGMASHHGAPKGEGGRGRGKLMRGEKEEEGGNKGGNKGGPYRGGPWGKVMGIMGGGWRMGGPMGRGCPGACMWGGGPPMGGGGLRMG